MGFDLVYGVGSKGDAHKGGRGLHGLGYLVIGLDVWLRQQKRAWEERLGLGL